MASFDVMPEVQLYQPAELGDALNLADELGEDGWLLGGGQDTYGWLKDRAKNPAALLPGHVPFRGDSKVSTASAAAAP